MRPKDIPNLFRARLGRIRLAMAKASKRRRLQRVERLRVERLERIEEDQLRMLQAVKVLNTDPED
jgi:hypothetical protein